MMYKLRIAIKKETKLLLRDKAGLAVMFAMPILLVIVITAIQNSTFKLVNENSMPLLVCNQDGGESSIAYIEALSRIGMFQIIRMDSNTDTENLSRLMKAQNALVAVTIPKGFSASLRAQATRTAGKALKNLGIEPVNALEDSINLPSKEITLYYNPILHQSFRYSVKGALQSAQQFTENREMIQAVYRALNSNQLSDSLQQALVGNSASIREVAVSLNGRKVIPDATQHNVPAWSIFAMFFIVVSLSTNIIKERLSGSFVRLQTLPTGYAYALFAKQVTYVLVTLAQVVVIFSIGIFLFPYIGLPQLHLPENIIALLGVSVLCGLSAVSYGLLIGLYAKTIEQAIGFGAVSVVILAAIGGIIVPAFAMPDSLRILMHFSPMSWCLQAYYTLFLEGGNGADIIKSIVPIIVFIIAFQSIAWWRLKRQHLI